VNGAVVQDLLEAADMLQLRHVVDACCSFLLQQLHESNCVGLCISYFFTNWCISVHCSIVSCLLLYCLYLA